MASLLKPCNVWDIINDWREGDSSTNQRVDLWVPRDNKGPDGKQWVNNPLIIWVHGGGWSGGTEDGSSIPFDRSVLVKRGFAVASVRYRLSTETDWPAQLVDTLLTVRELRARGADWRLWPTKIGMWGASAGGHLTAMAAVAANDPAYKVGNWPNTSSAIAIGCADYPPTDLQAWVNTPGFASPWRSVVTELLGVDPDVNPTLADSASPALRVTPAAAPLLIRHGTADTAVPVAQSRQLRDAYLANAPGSPCYLDERAGYGHGDSRFYSPTEITNIGNMFRDYLQP